MNIFNNEYQLIILLAQVVITLRKRMDCSRTFLKGFQKYTAMSVYLQIYKYISLLSLARIYVSTYGARLDLV